MSADGVEPTLAATTAAAEAARTANHAGMHAPTGDTGNVYDRAAALVDLLTRTEQLARVLGHHAARLNGTPGLFVDAERADTEVVVATSADLLEAAGRHLQAATRLTNHAWSELGHLGVQA